jgi:hypothetical protein
MISRIEETKKILRENKIPFKTLGDYVLVSIHSRTTDGEEFDLIDHIDADLLVTNDPVTTLILPYVYEEESDVYEALEYCNLYTGQ